MERYFKLEDEVRRYVYRMFAELKAEILTWPTASSLESNELFDSDSILDANHSKPKIYNMNITTLDIVTLREPKKHLYLFALPLNLPHFKPTTCPTCSSPFSLLSIACILGTGDVRSLSARVTSYRPSHHRVCALP